MGGRPNIAILWYRVKWIKESIVRPKRRTVYILKTRVCILYLQLRFFFVTRNILRWQGRYSQFIIRSFFGISLLNFILFYFNKLGLVLAWRWMDDEINQTDSQWFCFNQNMILTTSYFWLHSMAWFIYF